MNVPNELPPKTLPFSMSFIENYFDVSSLLTFSLTKARDGILNIFPITQDTELQL